MSEYDDRIRQIKVPDENDRSKRLMKRQMKMTDGNERAKRQIKCRYTREPVSLISPAAGEPIWVSEEEEHMTEETTEERQKHITEQNDRSKSTHR